MKYEVHTKSFQTFFVWAFKIVVDTWKFSMLFLYIVWDDWPIFMISLRRHSPKVGLSCTLLDKVNQFLPLSSGLTFVKRHDCFLRLSWKITWCNMNYHINGLHLFLDTVYRFRYATKYRCVCVYHSRHMSTCGYMHVWMYNRVSTCVGGGELIIGMYICTWCL